MSVKPPSFPEFALIAAGLGTLFGVLPGAVLGSWLGGTVGPTGPTQPGAWIGGGVAAGFVLGLLYAFLCQPPASREHEE